MVEGVNQNHFSFFFFSNLHEHFSKVTTTHFATFWRHVSSRKAKKKGHKDKYKYRIDEEYYTGLLLKVIDIIKL